MEFYILDGSKQKGPLTAGQVNALLWMGSINQSTLIWFEGLSEWAPIEKFTHFFPKPENSNSYFETPSGIDCPVATTKSGGAECASSPLTKEVLAPDKNKASLIGTKWLRFWTYFSLPVGGVFGLLSLIDPLDLFVFINAAVGVVQFILAYGLHHRKKWAWELNWIIIAIPFIGMITSTPAPTADMNAGIFLIRVLIKIVIGGMWLWINSIYWRKRKFLFE